MPRIRKKSSNRQTTRDRAKIKNKVSEHHKKVKKGAKKDVTWKSKKKADPGIPNSWPYKDKVLAELAAEKRAMEEAKLARKEANRNPNQHEPEDETPGIQSLHSSSVLTSSTSLPIAKASSSKAVEVEGDVPDLVDNELTNLQDVLDKADVLMEVVDARDIQGGRCAWVEGLVRDAGGRVILVVTKIDLVPKEAIEQWLPHLPPSTYLFSSSTASPSSGPSTSSAPASPQIKGRAELLSLLRSLPTLGDSDPVIALMGLPNSGKTTLLNSLLSPSAPRFPVAPAVGNGNIAKHPEPTTKAPVEVRLDLGGGKGVRVVDTPGWEIVEDEPEDEDEDEEGEDEDEGKWDELEERVAGDLLRRNLGRVDRVKDIAPLAKYIVSRSNAQDLMLAYNVPYFKEGDVEAFLTAVARFNGRVKKHGVVDLDAAARLVVRDWAQGSFPYYSLPPSTNASGAEEQGERPDMTHVLSSMKGRKEMRAGGGKGLIRFKGGEVDTRQIVLDDDYTAMMGLASDDEDENDDDEREEEDDDQDEDDDEDERDEEDEEEEEPFALASDEGEELVDLESGPEPSSGSSVEDEDEDEDDDEEEEEEEEEKVVEIPVSRKNKRKAEPVPSPNAAAKKTKRVSFGKDMNGGKGGGGGGGGKEFKGLGKRRR